MIQLAKTLEEREDASIPAGLCQCGCGQRTRVPKYNRKATGYIAGEPMKYIRGHQPNPRGKDNWRWRGGRRTNTRYVQVWAPEHPRAVSNPYVPEHILVAEKALGRYLPEGAVVHHANEDKQDNRPCNLVICPDPAYHNLLHARLRALRECGNPDWRKCFACLRYDAVVSLDRTTNGTYSHTECRRAYNREFWRRTHGKNAKEVAA